MQITAMTPLTVEQVREQLALIVHKAGSARALARNWGLSNVYLSNVLRGDQPPGPRILAHMGLRKSTTVFYERVE